METKEFNVLENRVICMNKVHSYINDIVPKLIEELQKGFKLTNDFQLFKKDKERIYKIIDSALSIPPGNFPILRAWLRITKYSMILEVDDNYMQKKPDKNGCSVCAYYKQHIYIYDVSEKEPYKFAPLKMVTTKQLEQAENDLQRLKKEKDNIEDKISKIQRLLN